MGRPVPRWEAAWGGKDAALDSSAPISPPSVAGTPTGSKVGANHELPWTLELTFESAPGPCVHGGLAEAGIALSGLGAENKSCSSAGRSQRLPSPSGRRSLGCCSESHPPHHSRPLRRGRGTWGVCACAASAPGHHDRSLLSPAQSPSTHPLTQARGVGGGECSGRQLLQHVWEGEE